MEVSRDEITRVLRMRGLPVKHSSTPSFAAAEKIGLRAIVWMMRPNVFAFADGLRVRAPLGLRIALSRRKQGFEALGSANVLRHLAEHLQEQRRRLPIFCLLSN